MSDSVDDNPYRAGEGASDAYQVSPPPGLQQPTSVKVFGILNLVFGVWGLFGTVFGVAMMLIANQQGTINGQDVWSAMTQNSPAYGVFLIASMILGGVFSVVLIVSGVWLLKSKRRGRTLSIAYAWFTIAFQIVGALSQYFWVMQPLFQKMQQQGGGGGPNIMAISLGASIGGLCIGMIYPILLLIFMNRPNVIASLR